MACMDGEASSRLAAASSASRVSTSSNRPPTARLIVRTASYTNGERTPITTRRTKRNVETDHVDSRVCTLTS